MTIEEFFNIAIPKSVLFDTAYFVEYFTIICEFTQENRAFLSDFLSDKGGNQLFEVGILLKWGDVKKYTFWDSYIKKNYGGGFK